jgi:enoyl-[acyl-carrier protein] reductase III
MAGQVVLITGGTRGIGRAVALRLARRQPAHIVVAYNSDHAAARETVATLKNAEVNASSVPLDVGDDKLLKALFDDIGEQFGRLDIFISNAARSTFRPAVDLSKRHWERVVELNATAFLIGAQCCRPLMQKGGRIVAMSSLGARQYVPNYTALGAAKATIEALVRYLAVELAPDGINVNGVCGGFIDTDSTRMLPDFEQAASLVAERTPAGRIGRPEDLAGVVSFLCSPESDWIRGQTLVADGGYSIVG